MTRQLLRIVFVLVFAIPAWSQDFRGSIAGIVTDPQGAVVPGVAIKATNTATQISYSSKSSSAGDYVIPDLPLGDYEVTFDYAGFSSLKINAIRVTGGTVYNLPATLTLAASSTVVEVSAAALSLDTSTPVQIYTIPREQVQNLPLNGRSFVQMAYLIPGANGTSSVNGRAGINFQVDGVDNNDPANGNVAGNQNGVDAIPGTLIPIDAIEEFSSNTQGGAETGKYAGAEVNLVIKSGTNQVHGSLYYYNRNEFFAAINPFVRAANEVNGTHYGKSKIRFSNWGGSLGGPIKKDKLFYFLAYERQQGTIGSAAVITEPSSAYVNEATALLATHNIAPNPIAIPLINTLWQPFELTGSAAPNNFFANGVQQDYSNNVVTKLDYSLNDRNRLSARWLWGQGSQTAPLSSQNPWYFQHAGMHIDNYAVILNSALSAKIENQVLLGVDYFNQSFSDANPLVNAATAGFIVGLGPGNTQGAPTVSISGFDGTGQSPFSARNDFSGHITDSLTLTYGKHSIHTGGEYRRTQIFEIGDGAGHNSGTRGMFTFGASSLSGTRGFAPAPGTQYSSTPYPASFSYNGGVAVVDNYLASLADFLQMAPNSATLVNGDLDRVASVNNFNLFVQDSYRISKTLNLNLGLRWDYLSPIGDNQQDLTVFDPSIPSNPLAPTGGIAVVGANISQAYTASALQLAPRVGFSWNPTFASTIVVRGGFGIYYDTPATNTWLSPSGLLGNPAGTRPDYNLTANYPIVQPDIPIFSENPSLVGTDVTANIAAVNPNFRTADTANFSLNVEKSLAHGNVIAQVGYVGSTGHHLYNTYDLNQTAPGAGLNKTPTGAPLSAVNGFAPLQYERPYFSQFPNFAQILQVDDEGGENYNSLQAIIRTRDWHHLISEYSYTYSHNLGSPSGSTLPTNNLNPRADYGSLSTDIRNQFKGFLTYDVPGFDSGPRWLANRWVTHNWQLTSGMRIFGGSALTATTSKDALGLDEGTERADLSGSGLYTGTTKSLVPGKDIIQWFNATAFSAPTFPNLLTTSSGEFYGPGFASVDLSIFKNFPIKERATVQFRTEMYNVFNRYNFANPTLNTGASSGQISGTIGGTKAPGVTPGEPFNIQFALKVLF